MREIRTNDSLAAMPVRMVEQETPLHEVTDYRLERVDAATRGAIRDLKTIARDGHPFGQFYMDVADILAVCVRMLDAIDRLDRNVEKDIW